jgi:RNA polymerase sigma factor (TIGR02999 family)
VSYCRRERVSTLGNVKSRRIGSFKFRILKVSIHTARDNARIASVDFAIQSQIRCGQILHSSGVPLRATPSQPVTELLARWSKGDADAREALIPLVYEELRRIARRSLSGQSGSHTLQPTALVHEAYLRLARNQPIEWQNRAHFFALAARMMRQILVDHARKHAASKRGSNAITVLADEVPASGSLPNLDVMALDDAMEQLAKLDPRQCRIVELRFFGGLSIEETAEVEKISPATTKREWATARLWLHRAMNAGNDQRS